MLKEATNFTGAHLQRLPSWVAELDSSARELLVSKSGKDPSAVGLQAADMIAYEVFKGIKTRTVSRDAEMRAVMKEFLSQDVPITARWIDQGAAQALYRIMKESGKYPDLDEQGIA